jgi:DNA-binding response OmpR family regulator
LALLDIMLPDLDGLAILQEARAHKVQTPVLLLTARNEIRDKVKGLDLGADDYLAKPFRIEELLARVRALTRRARSRMLVAGDLSMDTLRRLVERAGRILYLSPTEYSVLELLLERQGHAVSKKEILSYVWHDDTYRDPNTVEVYVNYLRNKLESHGGSRLIHTQRGAGYLLSPQSPDES